MSAETQSVSVSDWVGDWGYCRYCDAPCRKRSGYFVCRNCRIKAWPPQPAPAQPKPPKRATLRPSTVLIVVPADTPPRDRQVVDVVNDIAQERLNDGWSITSVFRATPLGADILVSRLAAKGISTDPKTVRVALRHLFGDPVGQLDRWVDDNAASSRTGQVWESGAFLYALGVQLYGLELGSDPQIEQISPSN
jgi:hypothetical protein